MLGDDVFVWRDASAGLATMTDKNGRNWKLNGGATLPSGLIPAKVPGEVRGDWAGKVEYEAEPIGKSERKGREASNINGRKCVSSSAPCWRNSGANGKRRGNLMEWKWNMVDTNGMKEGMEGFSPEIEWNGRKMSRREEQGGQWMEITQTALMLVGLMAMDSSI